MGHNPLTLDLSTTLEETSMKIPLEPSIGLFAAITKVARSVYASTKS